MYKIAICEDDKGYIETLKKLVMSTGLLNEDNVQFYEFYSGVHISVHQQLDFDVVFMDIQMNMLDGYETAMHLREKDSSFLLVFCSGVVKPTTKFFKAGAFRYLLKDFSEKEMLTEMTEIVTEMINRKKYPYVMCKYGSGRELIRVYSESILYIAIRGHGSEIFACGKIKEKYPKETLRVNESIKSLAKVFNESCGFVRIHVSYIVNMAYIEKTTANTVILTNGVELNIARSKAQHFQQAFTEFASAKYKE